MDLVYDVGGESLGWVVRVEEGVGIESMRRMVGEKKIERREMYGGVRGKKVFEDMEKLMEGKKELKFGV